ncbi:MAG: hypothetical protein IPG90_03945 [Bacteroidetes bacterium]|nr:hypothetical protein [Bacteroidota bacterium]
MPTTLLDDLMKAKLCNRFLFRFGKGGRRAEINISIQAYPFKAVRNSCLNKSKHGKVANLCREVTALAGQSEPASQITLQNELQEQIHRAIESLPEQCRILSN